MTDADTHTPGSSEPLPPHAPVGAARPNVTMLKADIDSGRTGDKEGVFDPGLSMLGTDDEAGGAPNTHEQVAMAREAEARARPGANRPYDNAAGRRRPVAACIYAAIVVVIGGGLVGALVLLR